MSRRLLAAGYELVVHDLRAEAVEDLVAAGAEAAKSPAEVAGRAEIVLVSLPTPQVVRGRARPHGLIHGGARTYVDPRPPDRRSRWRSPRRSERGITTLDAPVSGGVRGATAGTAVMAPDRRARARTCGRCSRCSGACSTSASVLASAS